MFTGIVQAMGSVAAIERRDFGVRLVIDRSSWAAPIPAPGDSVSISGVCLTVVEADDKQLAFDVVPQTLAETTLGDKRVGDKVNLEPSLTVGDAIGGHFVQGHVDGVGVVRRIDQQPQDDQNPWGGGHRITFKPPAHLMSYIVPRGSITLDGVSMTLADVTDDTFTVAVIPTTLAVTTLGQLEEGRRVNLETDILARTIVHRLQMQGRGEGGLDYELLRSAGFVD